MGETAELLSVSEVAALRGCGVRYIQNLASNGNIEYQIVNNARNRPTYQIPITALGPLLQQKYYAQRIKEVKLPDAPPPDPLDRFSAAEREEICYWKQLIEEWQSYRAAATSGNRAQVDDQFVLLCKLRGEEGISVNTLYVHWRALRSNDYAALIDKRGKVRKGKSKIDPWIWDVFLSFYFEESQYPVQQCLHYTELYTRKYRPELLPLPHLTTFARHIESEVPEAVEALGRDGDKAYHDRCGLYIRRLYDQMHSNEWWIADNHTFDIISQNEDGKQHRLYLTAFLDARSGIFTGCYVTSAPSSQSTLIALRRGILQYGIPDNIYVDNGREFLTYDIGGLGHRRRKPKPGTEDDFLPPPVFERLGIHMTNAIVRNAKAKLIERRFRDFKDQVSRLFATYTGGNVTEKPECLKSVLKAGKIPSDRDLTESVTALIEGQLNQSAYGGSVAADRGKSRMQVYNEQMIRRRTASEEDLNLMLMRSSRPQKVGRRGVSLKIGDQQIDYFTNEFVLQMQGEKVYYRYDPTDLSSVRVYDPDDRYLATLPTDNIAILKYGADMESVEAAMRLVRSRDRLVKDALSACTLQSINKGTALELALEEAEYNRQHGVKQGEAKVLEIQRAADSGQAPLLQRAVGDDLDIRKLTQNALKNKQED